MRVHFLGTAAAEGWPGLFCRCPACLKARELGGKNIRTRAGALIDDVVKVDFGPDTYMQALRDCLDFSGLQHIVFTHSHHDHFAPHELNMYQKGFAWEHANHLFVYGNDRVLERTRDALHSDTGDTTYTLVPAVPFQTLDIAGIRVTPLLADHAQSETCLVYLFETGDRTLLWGHDSGYFPADTWAWLRDYAKRRRLSGVVLDCTLGPLPDSLRNHLGIDGAVAVREEMISSGIAGEATLFVATHFSHNGRLTHEELEDRLEPLGFRVAFDGWRLDV